MRRIVLPRVTPGRRALLLAAGLLLAFLGQYFLGRNALGLGLILYAVSLPLAVFGMLGTSDTPATRETTEVVTTGPVVTTSVVPSRRYRLAGVALVILAVVAELALMLVQERGLLQPAQTWPWYFASWLVFMLGLLVADVQWKKPDWRALWRERRWELVTLLLILVLATVIRTWDLENTPVGLWGDEGNDGEESARVLAGKLATPFTTDWGANPALHQWVNALFFAIFGANIVALRLVAAVAGVCMILLTYVLGRQLWGPRLALLAAFFETISRWHIHRTRFDSVVVQGLPFQLLSFIFLFRALRTRRWTDFAWCGLFGGLGLNFYHGLRAVPIIIVIFLVYLAIPHPVRFLRRYGLGCLAAGAAAIFVFGPLGQYFLHNMDSFLGRANTVLVFNNPVHFQSEYPGVEPTPWNMVRLQARDTALMFNYRGDQNEVFNWQRKPQLDTLMSIVFVLGLAYAVWRWRDRRYAFLLIWFAVTMVLGSVLTVGTPHSVRTAGVIPCVMLLAAIGSERVFVGLWAALRRAGRWVLLVAAVIWLALMTFQNLDIYFNQYMPSNSAWYSRGGITTTISRALRPYAKDYRLYFFWHHLAHKYHNVVKFELGSFEGYDFGSLAEMAPVRAAADKGIVYAINAEDSDLPPALQSWYPGGVLTTLSDPWGKAVYFTFRLEPAEIAAHQGLMGRFYAGTEWAGVPLVERLDKQVALEGAWKCELPTCGPFSAEWQGTLLSEGESRYVGVATAVWASVEIDGETVYEGTGGGSGRVGLARGAHSIRLRARFPNGPETVKLVWGRSEARLTPIEPEALGTWPAAHGLLGAYYANADWSGAPAYYQVDPLMSFRWPRGDDPLGGPFSVEWSGALQVDTAGQYNINTECHGHVMIWLDEQLILDNAGDDDGYKEALPDLQAGSHQIRVRLAYQDGDRFLRIHWVAPGGERQVLPMQALTPAAAVNVDMPALVTTEQDMPSGKAGGVDSSLQLVAQLGGRDAGQGQLSDPLKVVALPDGRLVVVDKGNRRLELFDAAGKAVASWGQPDLVEPTDVDVGPSGELYVLDSGRGLIDVFSSAGKLERSMGQDWGMYAPRAMQLGPAGALYVVATGSNQVVASTLDGQPPTRFGTQGNGPGQFQQPSDLAVDDAGVIYVLDTMANKRVQRFDAGGQWLGEWPLLWAPDSGSPGIAYDPTDSTLYLTDPQRGRLYHYGPDGSLIEQWTSAELAADDPFAPVGVYVDGRSGKIYLVDTGQDRVLVYEKAQ